MGRLNSHRLERQNAKVYLMFHVGEPWGKVLQCFKIFFPFLPQTPVAMTPQTHFFNLVPLIPKPFLRQYLSIMAVDPEVDLNACIAKNDALNISGHLL